MMRKMALSCSINLKSNFSIFRILNHWLLQNTRQYSQYPSFYEKPVINKEEIEKTVKETPWDELNCREFRAAENNQTCSAYYDSDVIKFTNYIMKKGKKKLARSLVEQAFTQIKHVQLRKLKTETDEEKKREICISPKEIFHQAVKNSTPSLKVKKVKKSGTWYKVPCGITPKEAKFRAMKWIIESTMEKNPDTPFAMQLAVELIAAAEGNGRSIQKKIEMHKLCETNRNFAHYRWT